MKKLPAEFDPESPEFIREHADLWPVCYHEGWVPKNRKIKETPPPSWMLSCSCGKNTVCPVCYDGEYHLEPCDCDGKLHLPVWGEVPNENYQQLAIAIIASAARDLLCGIDSARMFFNSDWARDLCDLVGLEYSAVMEIVEKGGKGGLSSLVDGRLACSEKR